jgi:endonuclease/exonuclease/phosphatase family metal-dependent hydrolase
MKKSRLAAIGIGAAAIIGSALVLSQAGQDTQRNGLTPSSEVFEKPVETSENDALTIVSFNVRDMAGRQRTLEDFQEIARIVEGADILVLQELGAKAFKKSGDNEDLMARLTAATEVLKSYLGSEWSFVFAESATPETLGSAAEIPCIGFRTSRGAINLSAIWTGYYDLGQARDMGTFNVTCRNGGSSETFTIGTVHTKPTCPERGYELLRIADYIEEHEDENYILLGDFNWGYYSTCSNKYDGENRLTQLHDDGSVFQVFHTISYTGKGKDDNFRTNLDKRSTAQMYDQFFVCKNYADQMAKGGAFGEDCGFVSFSNNNYFESRMDDIVREQINGVKAYMRTKGFKSNDPETKEAITIAKEEILASYLTVDKASHKMSDHKPIWLRINLF